MHNMTECPLCGKPAINARTRLIKDTCGHTKCRMCLLQEESGCTKCLAQSLERTNTSIANIGSSDSFQLNVSQSMLINLPSPMKLPTNGVLEYLVNPFDTNNVIINGVFKNDLEKIMIISKNKASPCKNQYYEGNKKQINQVALNENGPIMNNKIYKDLFQNNEDTQVEQSDKHFKEQTETLRNIDVNNTNKMAVFNQSDITVLLLIDDKSPARYGSESTVEITEIHENENKNQYEYHNLPQKTPNQLIMYKSPEFRMSDYLVFNRREENIDLGQYIANPSQSLRSRSPEYRLSDYISFSRLGGHIYPQLIASPTQSSASSSPEFGSSDYIEFPQSGNGIDDYQLILSPTGNKSPEFRFSDYLIFNNQGKNTAYARLIQSPVDSRDPDSTTQSIEMHNNKTGNSHKNDDDDKENKNDSIQEKRIECFEKNPDVVNFSKADINNAKRKRKVNNPQKKSKKTKKDNEPLCVRKGDRKRKIKAKKDEIENEKVPKRSIGERRKKNKDWSHIVKLTDSASMYECTICKKSFSQLRSKSYHAACILGEAPFCCEICGRTFKKRSHFEYHQITHSGNKPFKCQNCQKDFATKSKLDRHMLSHKPQDKLECDECGKKLSTKDNLKSHLALHRNPSFKCKHCPKSFTIKANRNRHEQYCLNSFNKRFPCDGCSKVFEKDYLLDQHKRRLHRKGKTYSCQVCQRVFLRKTEVDRHATIHSGVKNFSCEICGVEFRRKDNLRRHERNHHSGPYEEDYGDVTPISVNESIPEASPKPSPKPSPKSRKRPAANSPTPNSPKPKKTPKKVKGGDSPDKFKPSSDDTSNGVQLTRGPINIKCLAGYGNRTPGKLTEPLSLEAALELNQQIEQKMHAQKTFCNFPGLTWTVNSPVRRESCGSNSNSNDGMSPIKNKFKDEVGIQHWRRRTSESFKVMNKS